MVGTDSSLVAAGPAGDSLTDAFVAALREVLRSLVMPIKDLIETYGNDLVGLVLATPYPNAVFHAPTNGPWPDIYSYYWDTMVPLVLTLYGLAVGLVILLESTSHLFSSYHRSKLKKRALAGLFGIPAWWWMAALSLRLMSTLTGFLAPDLSSVTFFEVYTMGTMGLLGVVISLATDFTLFALIALLYLVRYVVLFLYILLMPLLIVFWIPGVGPLQAVANFAQRLAGFYVPFLFMTLPVALLFRLSWVLTDSFDLSMGGFGAWILSLVLPFLAVVSPIVFVWQASALFFIGDRAAQRIESKRATERLASIKRSGQTTVQGSRNFVRGTRADDALSVDTSPDEDRGPRAHRAGRRLRATGSRLRDAVPSRGANHGGSDTQGQSKSSEGTEPSADADGASDPRANDFDTLREDSGTESSTDPPRYIQ